MQIVIRCTRLFARMPLGYADLDVPVNSSHTGCEPVEQRANSVE
jgi:hypothetical protein